MNITFEDMAEALDQIRKERGLYVQVSEQEILNRAILNKRESTMTDDNSLVLGATRQGVSMYTLKAYRDSRITEAWARTIIRIPNECARAKEDSRISFKELIGCTPEEFLKKQ